MIDYLLGVATGLAGGVLFALALATPAHVAICEHEGGEWAGEVCIKDGRVILDD